MVYRCHEPIVRNAPNLSALAYNYFAAHKGFNSKGGGFDAISMQVATSTILE
jgi:hypothetical protein